jgi:hypothetical protein
VHHFDSGVNLWVGLALVAATGRLRGWTVRPWPFPVLSHRIAAQLDSSLAFTGWLSTGPSIPKAYRCPTVPGGPPRLPHSKTCPDQHRYTCSSRPAFRNRQLPYAQGKALEKPNPTLYNRTSSIVDRHGPSDNMVRFRFLKLENLRPLSISYVRASSYHTRRGSLDPRFEAIARASLWLSHPTNRRVWIVSVYSSLVWLALFFLFELQ